MVTHLETEGKKLRPLVIKNISLIRYPHVGIMAKGVRKIEVALQCDANVVQDHELLQIGANTRILYAEDNTVSRVNDVYI